MSARSVWSPSGRLAGWTRKFVGATARTMGGDPVWVAYPVDRRRSAVVHHSYGVARDWLISQAPDSEAPDQ